MDNRYSENVIRRIIDLPIPTKKKIGSKTIIQSIMKIIYEEFKPILSNTVILWDNQIDSNAKPIIKDEFYPQSFNYSSYFNETIARIEEPIYPIQGRDAFIMHQTYFNTQIAWWHSICAFPLFNKHNESKAVIILLSSHSDIPLSKEDVDFLQKIINEIYNGKTSFMQNDVFDFIKQLSDFTQIKRKEKTLLNKYQNLSKALKNHENNIIHFSIWKIDDISKHDFNVVKEKNRNFKNIPLGNREKQIYRLNSSDSHRIIDYVKLLKQNGIVNDLENNDNTDLSKYIRLDVFKENDTDENSCFTKKYCSQIGMEINNTIILYIPIIPFRHNMTTDKTNILCLYINELQYTIFNSLTILSVLSRKIYESLTLHNQLITNDTTKEILEIQEKDEKQYYQRAANIIIDKNDCASCFIYMKEKTDDHLKMIIGKEDDTFINEKKLVDREISSSDKRIKITLPLSRKISIDSKFLGFVDNTIKSISSNNSNNYYLYYGEYPLGEFNSVYSAIIIPIKEKNNDDSKDFVGMVLFINKKYHRDQAKANSPYFSAHNELIVLPSIESIYRHKLLRDATKKKESLLGRIRHEIPHEVNLVTQNARILKKYFEEKIKNSYDNNERSIYAHRMNEINQLLLSGERIGLYTIFATSINFTKREILKNQEFLDFNVFLHSMEDIFKADAKEHGVDIKFDDSDANYKCRVSKLYKLAIINIIFNAIRYSRFGTWITVYIGKGIIKVENYGIGIKKEEEKIIYTEGYRGKEAIEFTEDGMGFGLFLAKKVIESHNNHYLSHSSEFVSDYNYAGIKSFFNYADDRNNGLELFNNNHIKKFTWDEYFIRRLELEKEIPDNYNHKNISFNHISKLIKNEFMVGSIPFDEFQRLFFDVDVYRTTFEVKFYN